MKIESEAKLGSISDEYGFFRLWLQNKFTEVCRRNPSYSLRSFAKKLNIDASSLSQIMRGKRKLSEKGRKILCVKLSATPHDLKMLGLIDKKFKDDYQYLQLSMDMFAVMSEWYHYAILELTYVSSFRDDVKWIAKKLSITIEEASIALERLKRLRLLVSSDSGLQKQSKQLTNDGIINTSSAHKELQRQIINKALDAVDECYQEEKDITSITMAIDPKKLDNARLLIKQFRRDICSFLEEGEQKQVYNLGIQLYPVSTIEE